MNGGLSIVFVKGEGIVAVDCGPRGTSDGLDEDVGWSGSISSREGGMSI